MTLDYVHHHWKNMESAAPEAEDTAFYAQLKRQILLLMDEDDETHARRNRKGESSEFHGRSVVAASGNYFSWSESGRSTEVPSWMERLWAAKGAGTGVFIPRAVTTGKTRRRRHNKARRNDGGRMHSCPGAGQKSSQG